MDNFSKWHVKPKEGGSRTGEGRPLIFKFFSLGVVKRRARDTLAP